MNAAKAKEGSPARLQAQRGFGLLFGLFLGLTLLKFGNPPIMERWVAAPTNAYEFVLGYPWPIAWAYVSLTVLAVVGFAVANWRSPAPFWLLLLPLAWLAWQFLASHASISPELSRPTLNHFIACIVCFYLGVFTLGRLDDLGWVGLGLSIGLMFVIATGFEQHFGGLEASRHYFYLYLYSSIKNLPPEYLKKLTSTRIFSTLFYPNALAGVLLLALPTSIGVVQNARRWLTPPARWFLGMVLALAGLACLYWSGSKGGWLLALGMAFLTLLKLPLRRRIKLILVGLVLVGGLSGFFWKYSGFFKKGATSVSARFDYWRAALATTQAHPVLGTGPGTFAIPYAAIKRPESEMARLAHNDYLEQASDSGIAGFVLYLALIAGTLVWTWPPGQLEFRNSDPAQVARSENSQSNTHWLNWFVWLGSLAWATQSLFEFGLYIPALAWPAFTFMGFLLSKSVKGQRQPLARNKAGREAY